MSEIIAERSQKLEKIRNQLKEEFIEIDEIINQIMVPVRGWYLFPELKLKPTVINLWGMTAVGKTSLIQRLVELLDYQDHYIKLDLLATNIPHLHLDAKTDEPRLICIDNFQETLSKTKRSSKRSDTHEFIWQLLGDGQLHSYSHFKGSQEHSEQIDHLSSCMTLPKSLIFTLGRLECLLPIPKTISADLLHKQTKSLNKDELKSFLQKQYKPHQMGRLGSQHITLPSPSKNAYKQKLKARILDLRIRLEKEHNLGLIIPENVCDIILNIGIKPSIGFRALENIIEEKIDQQVLLLLEMKYALNLKCQAIKLDLNQNSLSGKFLDGESVIKHIKLYEFPKDRDPYTEESLITSVYLAGQILCEILLNGRIPTYVNLDHFDRDHKGIIYYEDRNNKPLTEEYLKNRIASLMAGKVAEELIFGQENVTLSRFSGAQEARDLALDLIKLKTPSLTQSRNDQTSVRFEETLSNARNLAKNSLFKHQSDLMTIAKELLNHKEIEELAFVQLLKKHEIPCRQYNKRPNYRALFTKALA